jgi:hypothetical protein
MTNVARNVLLSVLAAVTAMLVVAFSERGATLVSSAQAVVGRPLTPMSYAGVARRTTRRAAVVGAATTGGAYASGCVQVADAYGRLVTRCR